MSGSTSFAATVWADLESFAELKKRRLPSVVGLIDVLLMPGVLAVLIFRIATLLHRLHLRPLSRLLYIFNMILFSVDLAPGAEIGPGLALPHPVGVAVAPHSRIGRRARIFQGVSVGGGAVEDPTRDGFPVIGDDCWLFAGAKVLGPVRVGDGAMVAANALVVRSVPVRAVVVGNPARVIRFRDVTPANLADAAAEVSKAQARAAQPAE